MKFDIITIEKIAKIIILIPTIIALYIFIYSMFSGLNGKNVSIEGNYFILALLIDIGILMIICVSVHEFIRTYNETKK